MAYKITENCIGCGACKKACPVFAITGEQKSLHEINAKRCIECGVCGRICPKEAVLESSGRVAARIPRNEWLKLLVDEKLCSACALCVEACAAGALKIAYPRFKGDIRVFAELAEPNKCVSCELCAKRCPLRAISMSPQVKEEAAV